jgi:NADP-dependent 3-hydroxy acid dehydrogenase YdfG
VTSSSSVAKSRDILVNNAGLIPSCQLKELAFAEWRRIMATKELFDVLAQRQAIPRAPTTADLVGTLSFLAGDDAAFVRA